MDLILTSNTEKVKEYEMRFNFSLEVLPVPAFLEAGLILTKCSFEVKVMMDQYKSEEMWCFWLTLIFIWVPRVIVVGLLLGHEYSYH